MSNWFYLLNGQQEGPVPQEELTQKLNAGELPEDTFIWSKGMKDWLRANEVEGFLTQETSTTAAAEQPQMSEEASAAAALAAALADDEPAAEAPAAEPAAPAGKLSLAKRQEPAAQPQGVASAQGPDQNAAGRGGVPFPGQQGYRPPTQAEAAYLYISPLRLIFMSIFTFGVYEMYWIYKNWKYAKMRDGLSIMPFWRAWFGIFHCHNLLRYIHTDRVLTKWREPKFKPGTLATIWVIMQVIANINGRVGSQEFSTTSLLGPLWPSFLCFLPVQLYINSVNKEMAPEAKKTGWTFGHIVLTIWGLLIWGILISAFFFADALMKYVESMPQQ